MRGDTVLPYTHSPSQGLCVELLEAEDGFDSTSGIGLVSTETGTLRTSPEKGN